MAARIAISNLHKETKDDWGYVVDQMYNYVNPRSGQKAPLIAEDVYHIIKENLPVFQAKLNFERDYGYEFFGFKTLERSYLVKVGDKIIERPQHMLMRVAVGIHKEDIASALETYELMSQSYYTHATPTLFNAGTPVPQMSSCFLLTMADDSIDGNSII